MKFFLGTHQPSWLATADVSLFVSRRRLAPRRSFPRAASPWALDSGGFTELSMFGAWRTDARTYAAQVRRFADEIGRMAWAAPQDWMCEPLVRAKTGLSVETHQALTIDNYLELKSLAPDLPIVPVVQGWSTWDYVRHAEEYARRGVDLRREPVVGLGTVCRRQGTREAEHIVRLVASDGIRLHGFGVKTLGLARFGDALASADSLAWSFDARRLQRPMDGCAGHKNCANCLRFALAWRRQLFDKMPSRNGARDTSGGASWT